MFLKTIKNHKKNPVVFYFCEFSRSQQQIHQSQPVVLKSSKKISYEEDLQLPESGSLVQGVSVDPNSAVFGRNGVRLEELERQFQNGLPDVTVGNYYHQHHLQQHQQLRPTPYLSSFQPATAAAAVPNPWQNSNHMGKRKLSKLTFIR